MTHGVVLVGCGAMARVHCTALASMKQVRLVAAVDIDADRARGFQAEYGFQRTGTDYRRELDKDDFDIVLAATHWPTRLAMLTDCFNAGKHVLSEKPLSAYPDEVDAIIALANGKGLKLRVGMMERFRPMFLKIKQLLDDGVIGRPLVYSFQHHQRPSPAALDAGWAYLNRMLQGGITPNVDCGIHKCDLTRMFSGADPVNVHSRGLKLEPDAGGNNYAHSTFELSNGAVLVLEDCFSRNTESFIHMWILGDKGRILFEYAGSHDRPIRCSTEDIIYVWDRDHVRHETFYTPLLLKPVGPQMESFIREIENDEDLSWHYDNIRQATGMVMGSLLSEHRGEIVRLPLKEADCAEIRRLVR